MVKTRNLWIAAAATLAAGFLATPQASAQNNFYQGKTVTIIVGFTPGGGYDQYARTLARHFGRHIPGNPTIIVQNLPSAGSLTAVRTLDTTAPKDGTVITTFNPGLITESVVDPSKFDTKFADYAWVGSIASDVRACYAWGASGIKNWDDMMKRKEWILGSTAKGSGNYVNGATLRELFGAPIRQILGFPGSAEIRLAIERGELEGDCGSWSSIPETYMRDKKINVIVRFADRRPDDMPANVPYVGEYAKTQEQKDMLELISGADSVGRPYIMSKQVPADRLQIIRTSFDETMKDPQFLADAEKQGLQVSPARGVEVQPVLERMAKAPATTVAKVKKIFE